MLLVTLEKVAACQASPQHSDASLNPFALNINLFSTADYVSLVSISSMTTRRVITVIQLNLHCYVMGLDTCNNYPAVSVHWG